MLALIKVNMGLFTSSMNSMNDQIAKVNISAIVTVLDHDFRKMGYGYTGSSLQEATPSKISFMADMNNNGTAERVTWELVKTKPVTETTNPRDNLLMRTVQEGTGTAESTPIKMGVVTFKLAYFDQLNNSTADLSKVHRIDIQVKTESVDPIGDDYMKATWQKKFYPISISE